MDENKQEEAGWYVAHTYSGYENKVKASIEATVENRNMENVIQEIQIPVQEVIETKNGKKTVKEKKLFPGYVMIKMYLTDDSWYVVRNTRGVTGFVGPSSKPVPLSQSELKSMGIRQQVVEIDLHVGEEVKVVEGPLEGFTGVIEEVSVEKSKVKVNISMFGRDTPTELAFEQVMKLKA